tara:strand:- start:20885 stop:21277 length:393 start_codon:yes stop_codon:yes gene_type:complete
MNNEKLSKEKLIELTKEHIKQATHHNIEYLEKMYSDKLIIVMVDENDQVNTMDKEQTITYFKDRVKNGSKHLSQKSNFLFAGGDATSAMVIVSREMEFNGRLEKMLFTLIWENSEDGWHVVKESASVKPI